MATLNRRPLANRTVPQNIPPSLLKHSRVVSGVKRPRSPERATEAATSQLALKRAKSAAGASVASVSTRDSVKERNRREREQEFKDKYTRAFPEWVFYFEEGRIPAHLQARYEDDIDHLGGRVVKFFDATEVTHFVTDRTAPTSSSTYTEKENIRKPLSRGNLKSPINLKTLKREEPELNQLNDPLLTFASLEKKIWTPAKLDSVLGRLLDSSTAPSPAPSTTKTQPGSLAKLLKKEQLYGSTERDPTQKRNDYQYFSKGSKFVLVEDMRQELATIAVHEYTLKSRQVAGGKELKETWPVLHCHPNARGPFIPFDEKEKRRWEKQQKMEEEDRERARRDHKRLVKQVEGLHRRTASNLQQTGDLRRTVSMNNLHRRGQIDAQLEDELNGVDALDSANASGYIPSGTTGYMAASGNSVGITSTTGTTSTAGYPSRNGQLSTILNGRLNKHVTTSMKFPSISADKENKAPLMGPPTTIPERQPFLKKSKSTNTLKLPKREEGSKPGYCESCRQKFEDFKEHIQTRKHVRFATNDANFAQLDFLLARVRRKTKAEVYAERSRRLAMRKYLCGRFQIDDGNGDTDAAQDGGFVDFVKDEPSELDLDIEMS